MNNDITQAYKLITEAFSILKDEDSISEMKYKTFRRLKANINEAVVLMNAHVNPKLSNTPVEEILFDFFDVNYPEWRNETRRKKSSIPRQILQYLLTAKTRMLLQEIAKQTGDYHHSTVINSRRVVLNMLQTNDANYITIYNQALTAVK